MSHDNHKSLDKNQQIEPVFGGEKLTGTKVCIVGSGLMGRGIAHVAARSGFEVVLVDIREDLVSDALKDVKRSIGRDAERGRMTQDEAEAAISRVRGMLDLREAAGDADLVIEAVSEDMEIKKRVFRELDGICPKHTVLATNTSSLSITEIASATGRPDKVIGLHFMNPAQVIGLVEIIRGAATSEETFQTVKGIAELMKKTPIDVRDSPAFVVNRLLIPMLNEAMFLLMEGVAKAEDIDKAMKLACNHPMGPIELADLIGLDICLAIMGTLYRETGDPKFRPCPLLRKMVRAGNLGRKVGRGFYEYQR
jgi:3-hydroxybutyryl-CoA dehydrogenase